jgi:hypothetical protein
LGIEAQREAVVRYLKPRVEGAQTVPSWRPRRPTPRQSAPSSSLRSWTGSPATWTCCGCVMFASAALNFRRRQCNPLCFVSAIHYAGEAGSRYEVRIMRGLIGTAFLLISTACSAADFIPPGPAYGTPAYGGPVYDEPVYDEPVYGAPVYGGPAYVYRGPGYGGPAYGAPVYGGPVYGGPVYGAPVYGGPVYRGPVYGGPIYGGPAYGAPVYGGVPPY